MHHDQVLWQSTPVELAGQRQDYWQSEANDVPSQPVPLIALHHQHGIHQVLWGNTQVELAGQRQARLYWWSEPALRTNYMGGSLHHVSLTAILLFAS